jgi:hypothetical protein
LDAERLRRLRSRVQQLAAETQAALARGEEPPPLDPDAAVCCCKLPRDAHGGSGHRGSAKNPQTGERLCLRYRADQLEVEARRAYASLTSTYADDLRAFERLEAAAHVRGKARRGDGTSVRPSDLGTCRRKVSARILQPEGLHTNITDGRPRRQGSVVHRDRRSIVAALYPWRQTEVPFRLPGLPNTFFADEYDPVTGDVFETKTAGQWQWDRTNEHGAAEHWIDQALLGAFGLEQAGRPVGRVRIVVVQRADGHDLEFPITWDDHARAAARDAIGRLLALQVAVVQQRQMLPRDRTGPSTDPICARYCEFRDWCWNLPRARELGVSGESLDVLGEQPADEQILWALQQVYERRGARKAAQAAEDEARSWLTGRTPAVYTAADGFDYVLAAGAAGRPQYSKWREEVLAEAEKPEHLRRPPGDIPVPKGDGGDLTVRRRVHREPKRSRAQQAAATVEQPAETGAA